MIRYRLIISWFLVILVSLVVFGSIGVYSIVNLIPKYEQKIESILSEKLNAKVNFKIKKIVWTGVEPVIRVTDFSVNNPDKGYTLKLKDIVVKLDLIESLISWRPTARAIEVNQLHIKMNVPHLMHLNQQNKNTQFQINKIMPSVIEFLNLLASQENILFNKASVTLDGTDQSVNIPFKLVWQHIGYHQFQLVAKAILARANKNYFNLKTKVNYSTFTGIDANGNIELQLSHFGQYINHFFKMPYLVKQNFTKIHADFKIENNQFIQANGDAQINHLVVEKSANKIFHLNNLSTKFHYKIEQQKFWKLDLEDFSSNVAGEVLTFKNLDLYGGSASTDTQKIKVELSSLNLSAVSQIFHRISNFFDIQRTLKMKTINQIELLGNLSKIKFLFSYARGQIENWEVSTLLNQVGIYNQKTGLLMRNLSGEIYSSKEKGWILIDTNTFIFGDKTVFEKPIPPVNIHSFINWKNMNGNWDIYLNQVGFKEPEFEVTSYGSIHIPEKHPEETYVKVYGWIKGQNVGQRFKNFLPKIGVDPDLYQWLTKTIQVVEKANANFVIDGPITKMPFQHNEGTFGVVLNIYKTAFYPYYQWPLISDINARLWVQNPKIEIFGTQGQSEGADVTHASFLVPNISPGVPSYMLIKGQIKAERNESNQYILDSPLMQDLGMLMHNLDYTGQVDLDLSMQFPLGNPGGQKNISGDVHLHGGQAFLSMLGKNVYELSGDVAFENNAYTIQELTGWFDSYSPVSITLSSNEIENNKYVYSGTLNANLPINGLVEKLPDSVRKSLSGYVPVHADFSVSDTSGGKVNFKSYLFDIDSKFPEPFHINKQGIVPFYGKMSWNTNLTLFNAEGNFNNNIDFATTVDIADLDHIPVVASLQVPQINAEKWYEFFTSNSNILSPILYQDNQLLNWEQYQPKSSGIYSGFWYCPNMMPNINCLVRNYLKGFQPYIQLKINELNVSGHLVKDLLIKTNVEDAGIDLAANSGNKEQLDIKIPLVDFTPWQIEVNNVQVKNKQSAKDVVKQDSHPEKKMQSEMTMPAQRLSILPPMHILIKNLKFLGRNVHDSTFKITPLYDGISIPLFLIRDVGKSLVMGEAEFHGMPLKAHLSVDATSDDWGQLLNYYGYSGLLEGGNGPISAEFDWNNTYMPEISDLSGYLMIDIKDGVINKVKPGIAKLIGVFSINTYLSRLTTSYSDFTTSGMMFNKIMGRYIMVDGVAKTAPQVEIAAPSFDALITGIVNFKKNTINQTIKLQPHLSGIFAIAAGVLGGPIIGVATYVIEELISNTVLKDSGLVTIQISGDLTDPKVSKKAL